MITTGVLHISQMKVLGIIEKRVGRSVLREVKRGPKRTNQTR